MEKNEESVRIELSQEQRPEQADKEPKAQDNDLEVSELESRIAPSQVGTFF